MSTVKNEPILSSSISLTGRTLWFGTAKLYNSHLSISGWGWTGRFEKDIPIGSIRLVEKWSVLKGPNLVIHLSDEVFHCRVKGVGFWEREFDRDERIDLKLRH